MIHEYRTAPLLRILAYSLPFGAIHSCISGYYYGLKKAMIPSVSQLIEQIVRVASVYVIYRVQMQEQIPVRPAIAVWGMESHVFNCASRTSAQELPPGSSVRL